MNNEEIKEKIRRLPCRVMMSALFNLADGLPLTEALDLAIVQIDDEDIKALDKAKGRL